MSTTFKGCASLLAVLGIVLILMFAGTKSIISQLAAWDRNSEAVAIAEQQTEQTRIQWGAQVQMAEIAADTTKKTDNTFVAFWVLRAFAWGAGIIVVAILATAGPMAISGLREDA
jgi:hypothetical protein